MNKLIDWMFGALIVMCVIGLFLSMSMLVKQMDDDRKHFMAVMYDCRIAEISPDVPTAVKQECRKRMEKK